MSAFNINRNHRAIFDLLCMPPDLEPRRLSILPESRDSRRTDAASAESRSEGADQPGGAQFMVPRSDLGPGNLVGRVWEITATANRRFV